jgi:hypothetical protein
MRHRAVSQARRPPDRTASLDVAAGGGWMIANENVAFVFRMTSMGYGTQDVVGGTGASARLETQLFTVLNEVVRLMGVLL